MFVVCRSATQPGIGQDLTSPLASTLSAQLEIQSTCPPHPILQDHNLAWGCWPQTQQAIGRKSGGRWEGGYRRSPISALPIPLAPPTAGLGRTSCWQDCQWQVPPPQAPHWAFQLLHNPQALSETRSVFSGLSPVPSQLMPSWPTGGQSLHPISHSHGLAAPLAPPAPLHLVFTLLQSCPHQKPTPLSLHHSLWNLVSIVQFARGCWQGVGGSNSAWPPLFSGLMNPSKLPHLWNQILPLHNRAYRVSESTHSNIYWVPVLYWENHKW